MKLSANSQPSRPKKASRPRLFPLWLIILLLTAACGGEATAVPPTASGGGAVATAPAAGAANSLPAMTATVPAATAPAPPATVTEVSAAPTGTASGAAGGATFRNPVLAVDFPDPDVLQVGDTYYAYATNSHGKNIQVASSPDLVQWEVLADAMPALAPWVDLSNS